MTRNGQGRPAATRKEPHTISHSLEAVRPLPTVIDNTKQQPIMNPYECCASFYFVWFEVGEASGVFQNFAPQLLRYCVS